MVSASGYISNTEISAFSSQVNQFDSTNVLYYLYTSFIYLTCYHMNIYERKKKVKKKDNALSEKNY